MEVEQTAAFSLGTGPDAVLLIHGFTGSPWEMRPLGEALAGRGLHVYCPRLPGHGTTPEAMLGAGHEDWLAGMEEALVSLSHHRRVFVSGLSVGALLALILAARHPTRISALGLLAPALRFRKPEMWLAHRLRNTPVLDLLVPWVTKNSVDLEDPHLRNLAPVLPAFPSTRLRDVWALQQQARAALADVRCPVFIAVARHDHVVDASVGEELARGLVHAHPLQQLLVEEGFHQIPRDRGGPKVSRELGDFFHRLAPIR